jgi:hypothetical protein
LRQPQTGVPLKASHVDKRCIVWQLVLGAAPIGTAREEGRFFSTRLHYKCLVMGVATVHHKPAQVCKFRLCGGFCTFSMYSLKQFCAAVCCQYVVWSWYVLSRICQLREEWSDWLSWSGCAKCECILLVAQQWVTAYHITREHCVFGGLL